MLWNSVIICNIKISSENIHILKGICKPKIQSTSVTLISMESMFPLCIRKHLWDRNFLCSICMQETLVWPQMSLSREQACRTNLLNALPSLVSHILRHIWESIMGKILWIDSICRRFYMSHKWSSAYSKVYHKSLWV